MFPLAESMFPLAENMFPLRETVFPRRFSEHVCSGPEPRVAALRSFCFTKLILRVKFDLLSEGTPRLDRNKLDKPNSTANPRTPRKF